MNIYPRERYRPFISDSQYTVKFVCMEEGATSIAKQDGGMAGLASPLDKPMGDGTFIWPKSGGLAPQALDTRRL